MPDLTSASVEAVLPWRPARARPGYGPAAETRDPIRRLAAVIASLAEAHTCETLPLRVAEVLPGALRTVGLLAPCHREGSGDTYRRHLLYADSDGRFSILALVWGPGQGTPVHGHTAWGCVGVYEGELTVSTYALTARPGGMLNCCQTATLIARPGDIGHVQPGIGDIHRICNRSNAAALSIHVYGRDLLREPGALNIVLPD